MRKLMMAAALILSACGEAEAPRAVAAVDTVDGVERWIYGADRAASLPWSLDTLAVLGDAFAEDEYQFNDVARERLAGDAAGNLYVLDAQGSRVLKYGPDGRYLATYGRKGAGPAELSQPLGLDLGPGDTVWVSDFSNGRLTGYPQPTGDVRTLPFQENSGFPSPGMAVNEHGFVLLFRPMFNFRGGPGGRMSMTRGDGEASDRLTLPLLRFDGSLQPMDTLWETPEPPMDMVELQMGDRMIIAMMSREFWPEFMWQPLSGGGVVVSDSAGYVLRLVDGDGRVERVIQRAPAPRLTTEADREAVRARLRAQEAEGGTAIRIGGAGPDEDTREKMLEQRLAKMTFADVIPQVVRLQVDPQDRIWVGVAEEVADSVARIDVYDRAGQLLGELRDFPMPDVFLGEDRIGVLRRDELDVQQVVVMRLNAAGAG